MTSTPLRSSRSSKPAPAAAPRARTRAGALATGLDAAPPSPAPEPDHPALSDPMRQQWVAEAAYFIAERRGFLGGSPEDDWSQAEVQIDRMLAGPPH